MKQTHPLYELVKNPGYGLLRAQFTVIDRYMKKQIHNMYFLEDKIFHYTDLNGLIGILENKGFWLSEAKFLNDSEELYNGVKLTIELINKLISKPRYLIFKDVLEKTIQKLQKYDFKNNYIASFSTKSDDLNQWRAYAKNGNGVCICFDTKVKTTFPHFNIGNVWQLHKVIYNDKIKFWILHSIIFKYFYEYKKDLRERCEYLDIDDYIQSLTNSLIRVFINFKNKAFESEQEVRLVYFMGNPLDIFNKKYYRNVNNIIVPYICTYDTKLKNETGTKHDIDLIPISEIIVGSSIHQEVTLDSIKNFINDIGYNSNIVKSSTIPYRG